MLKGIVAGNTRQFPPKTHNLIKLAQLATIDLDDKQNDFLEKLGFYYIQSRYPEEIKAISEEINRGIASDYLDKTKEILEWLKQKIR